MGQLVKIKLNQTEIWMEVESSAQDSAPVRVSAESVAAQALDATATLQGIVRAFCASLVEGFQSTNPKPEKVTVEFGLRLSGDAKFYVVNIASEASLQISAEWKLD